MITGQGRVTIIGLVNIKPDKSLSTGALAARQIRETLHSYSDGDKIKTRERVRVSHEVWEEYLDVLFEENPDFIVLEWPVHFDDLQITPEEALIRPPCDIVLVRGPIPEDPKNILVALRGSVHAEYALRVSLLMGDNSGADVTTLHMTPSQTPGKRDRRYRPLAKVLDNLPEIEQIELKGDDPGEVILEKSRGYDILVMGMSSKPRSEVAAMGPLTESMFRDSPAGVIAVKSQRIHDYEDPFSGQNAISILVDKWFAENTFHADEFADLEHLYHLKEEQDLQISLALPALNEEQTVGKVIRTIKRALMDDIPLLDEIVLMDSNSTDRTREIAVDLGIPVHIHQQVLPRYGARHGKGEALWKSLFVTRGDIIVWVDTDIVNIHPRFVFGLLGPLLTNPPIQFVKGFYRRPLRVGEKIQAGGGGRVTELTARPLLNLFYPELSGVVQPLSGEYGGRRTALEKLTFFSGYGVETGLLIDIFEKFGVSAIAQVDLNERIHHNQPLESLGKMSFAIIQTVIHKLEQKYGLGILEDANKSMKLIRYEPGRLFLEIEEIAERERPPMIEIPEYTERQYNDTPLPDPARAN
jgi:glucosyl-3-phosphoglycerate synthase